MGDFAGRTLLSSRRAATWSWGSIYFALTLFGTLPRMKSCQFWEPLALTMSSNSSSSKLTLMVFVSGFAVSYLTNLANKTVG